ncbi:aminoglycoside 6'-N-acetyltransferase [Actinacidiphila yanglinensis]|uniref:Lysine N-acyltransferase MbtK n=1 Tax=Actinacidiphila yanglinensis TaxID=310779 RepID=A0A1H5T7V7_9ACTN|nr:GNAT family N-acetyltransferase [Actinacidiphila yanglinensis]SEF58923.1 aminoglycoside 6'-N-acetyltransferase [Actinacidiphila yanglinensis]
MPVVSLRPLTRADFPLLREWLEQPHVRQWWREPEPTGAAVEAEYGPVVDGRDPTLCAVILADGQPVGLIQGYRHADSPDWDRAVGIPHAAGLDYLVGPPERRGQGIAPTAIAAFADLLLHSFPDVSVVVSAPQLANDASCRALQKAGFTHVRTTVLDSPDPSDAGPSALYTYAPGPKRSGGPGRARPDRPQPGLDHASHRDA